MIVGTYNSYHFTLNEIINKDKKRADELRAIFEGITFLICLTKSSIYSER